MRESQPMLRGDASPLPLRMRGLPIYRGLPIFWHIPSYQGLPIDGEFDRGKWRAAVLSRRCWLCGQHLADSFVFDLDIDAAFTRNTIEPAVHRQCAKWRLDNYRVLMMDDRYSRLAIVWQTRHFRVLDGGALIRPSIRVGEAEVISTWKDGSYQVCSSDIEESVYERLPLLERLARSQGPKALREFERRKAKFDRDWGFYPKFRVKMTPEESIAHEKFWDDFAAECEKEYEQRYPGK